MKKLWFILIAVALVVGAVMLIPQHAKAATDGMLTYEIVDGEATITGCDTSISGELVIPSTLGGCPVTVIGYGAFGECENITSIELPYGIKKIETSAFDSCSSLLDINIPESVTVIETSAFHKCTSLVSIEIPDSITKIESYMFWRCTSLKDIIFPENLTSIGNSAFANTAYYNDEDNWDGYALYMGQNLLEVKDDVKGTFEIKPGTKLIGGQAFYGCSGLTNIEIPTSVEYIGTGVFTLCESLEKIHIPDSVKSIGNFAFSECRALLNITIPDSVTEFGSDIFYECSSLESARILADITCLDYWLFCGCISLESVEIPASVTQIRDSAFYACESLTTVYFQGTEDDWNKIIIEDGNEYLVSAEIIFNQSSEKSELEEALDGKDVTVGKLANETEVVIVPTVSGNVAMTESELAEMLGDGITIVSNNGVIGTGSKIIIGEQEVEIAVKGDIDGDGIATVFDALMVKKALAENTFGENDIREFAGDIDGAGVTDTADIDAILAHIVGEMLIA